MSDHRPPGSSQPADRAHPPSTAATPTKTAGSLMSPLGGKLEPAVMNYTLICLTALVVLFLALMQRGFWPWALFPVVVGVVGVSFRWRTAVFMVLLFVAGLLFIDAFRLMVRGAYRPLAPFHLSDLMICGSVVVFAIADFRLLSLSRNIFPRDPRRVKLLREEALKNRKPRGPRSEPLTRLPAKVTVWEIGWFLAILPVWIVGGQLLWLWLGRETADLYLNRELWRLILFLWLLFFALMSVGAVYSYMRLRRMNREEAMLVLQDAQWLETREEQRSIGRWLQWARYRAARRTRQSGKEKS